MTIRQRRRAASKWLRAIAAAVVALPLAGIASFEALFAPSAELWPRWQAHDPAATATIDHVDWERLLKTYVSADGEGVNRFDYGRVGPADRAALDAYIASLSTTEIDRYSRAEQKAFWINLYNALTVRVILVHYPVASIRDIDISPGLFADGPWDKPLVTVAGEDLTLNDIEHRILRPIWSDPRIHYAVNCASIGCPNLKRMAYSGAKLELMLDMAARTFVNSARGVSLEQDKLFVSSIYVWFQEDFGGDDRGVIDHLTRYAAPELAVGLRGIRALSGHAYDWSLNDVDRPAIN